MSIAMDVKKSNKYLRDLYVDIPNLKWLYGSQNRKDVNITCLAS